MKLVPTRPAKSLHSALLDAFWKWVRVELDEGRQIPEDANEPVKIARRLLAAGEAERAAIECGKTDIGLQVWELAMLLHDGLCPEKYIRRQP